MEGSFVKLWNRTYTKNELRQHVGDLSQVCGVRQTVLSDGPGRGMRAFDVTTGSGLAFTILPDRGMDIAWCTYKSIPIGFISKAGPIHPALGQYGGTNFLRAFTGGLLTTCGYTHMGSPCEDEGQQLGLHGRATFLPADQTAVLCDFDGDEYVMRIRGSMREASVLGENILFSREIRALAGESNIRIIDRVENAGDTAQPLMLLYHFNFGHPLLDKDTILLTSPGKITPKGDEAAAALDTCKTFHSPMAEYKEQLFYHDLEPDTGGMAWATLQNPTLGIYASIYYNKAQLPHLVQWKQLGINDYVCGLEPATWYPEGRKQARSRGELITLAPGEIRDFSLRLELGEL